MENAIKISEAASIAMHAMSLLAADPGARFTAGEIAGRLDVSEAHLSKVLQRLARQGFVDAVRGPGGGFMLGKKGRKATLMAVLEAIEGPFKARDCLMKRRICRGRECIFGSLLEKMNGEFREYLAGTTIADLGKSFETA